MTKTFSGFCLYAVLSVVAWGCTDNGDHEGLLQLKLPKALREISGLTELPDARLLAVADQKAQIYSIDFVKLKAEKFAQMGDPVGKGDFEGIALLDDFIYLVTSNGKLWRQGLQAEATDYEKFKTGIGKQCEVEGLTAWPARDVLLILCKKARSQTLAGKLSIFAWSAQSQTLVPGLAITRSYEELGLPRLRPSGISFTDDGQHLFIVAAKEKYFVVLSVTGELIRAGRLPNRAIHRQTEGVVITSQNTLYLADEGGKGKGTITRYEPSF